ncbi:23067_t:CDS:2, partial [Cetraspora pellucida]
MLYIRNKLLQEQQLVVKYNKPGCPSFLQTHSNLLDYIHDSIEFGATENKRKRKIVKVRTINYLVDDVRNIYSEYVARFTINNYLQSSCSNLIVAKTYHYPANIMVSSVSRTDNNNYSDEHYCLVSIKDDKAKVPFGITAVRRTFRVLQTIREPVMVSNYNFLVDVQQKLILSVYLIISPNDTNVMLHNSQLSIFIHSQYGVDTSSATYMQDLDSLVKKQPSG